MNIRDWYTVRHLVLVHNWTDKQKCYGNSTGVVQWLAYEVVQKNNIKDMDYNNVDI